MLQWVSTIISAIYLFSWRSAMVFELKRLYLVQLNLEQISTVIFNVGKDECMAQRLKYKNYCFARG